MTLKDILVYPAEAGKKADVTNMLGSSFLAATECVAYSSMVYSATGSEELAGLAYGIIFVSRQGQFLYGMYKK